MSIHRLVARRACVLALIGAVASSEAVFSAEEKIKVMATIFPLQEFAREVGGGRVEARLLIPSGADIHSWRPSVGDIRALSADTDLFLYVGPSLEPWAERLLRNVARPDLKTLEAARGLPLIASADEDEPGADPHVWLDFSLDLAIVDRLAGALSEISPSDGAAFRSAAEAYRAELRGLDQRYAEALRPCRGKTLFLGGHAAFGYLARRYGLVQVAVSGPNPDAAPVPGVLMGIVARAKAEGARTVFADPGSGDRMARVLADEIGGEVVRLYPGHNPPLEAPSAPTFLELMERNLEALRRGLGCR